MELSFVQVRPSEDVGTAGWAKQMYLQHAANLQDLKVSMLSAMLRAVQQPATGVKGKLIERLNTYFNAVHTPSNVCLLQQFPNC